ncbi:MAG: hypothetical protein ACRELX_08830 [Longimicrobiales bacterium]
MLRTSLRAIDGVDAVAVDEHGDTVVLICAHRSASPRILEDARRIVSDNGSDPDALTIITTVRTDRIERRARFDRVERYENADREVRVRVFLEWEGALHSGDAVGEKGFAIELRTAAAAAIDALEKMTGEALGVRLVGVKQVRAFDGELTVVSLYRIGSPSQKLLGSVLTGADPLRAAAVAVLNALNRTLGNLLSR